MPDDPLFLRDVEESVRAYATDDQIMVEAMRVPVLVGPRSCLCVVVDTDAVNAAMHLLQTAADSGKSFTFHGAVYSVYPSLQSFVNRCSELVDLDQKPSFVICMSGLPCVSEATQLVYRKYFEKCAYAPRDASVDSIIALNSKVMGVNTNHRSGVLIVKLRVIDAQRLHGLRATPVPAIIKGGHAGYYLSSRNGTLKIIEVDGEKAESLSCCGVLKGREHRMPDCLSFLANKHKRTAIVAKLEPVRAHKKHVTARAQTFLSVSRSLYAISKKHGYPECRQFFRSGMCTFGKCSYFPCGFAERSSAVRDLLDTLK